MEIDVDTPVHNGISSTNRNDRKACESRRIPADRIASERTTVYVKEGDVLRSSFSLFTC